MTKLTRLSKRRSKLRSARKALVAGRDYIPSRFGRLKNKATAAIKSVRSKSAELTEKINTERQPDWPATANFREVIWQAPNHWTHAHVAMCDRQKLIALSKIAEEIYGLRVGEFPPFDSVEDVHTTTSYHYRQSGQCFQPRSFSQRGDGLAIDLTGVRTGDFIAELRARY